MNALDRFKGCLLGLAVGDALGAPVEFLPPEKIREKYRDQGLQDFDLWEGFKPGSITDDTQLTLATAKGCINAYLNLIHQGESNFVEFIRRKYAEWLERLKDPFHVRHPGYTCMHVLQSGEEGTVGRPLNDSLEPSGLFRTAPVGLAFPPTMAFREGIEYAALTHGHPSSYLAAGFFAEMISRILEEKTVQEAVELSIDQLITFEKHESLLERLEKTLELFIDQKPLREAVAQIGEPKGAEEVLAVGITCALRHVFEFKEGVLASVNVPGFSSSTGVVTGAILGAFLGAGAIPDTWISRLENAGEIAEIAEDMWKVFKKGERIPFDKYGLAQE
ncbi:MAG: ADP-ribosylglycohydrolase family protein [Candidatus Aminicenantales bacterium]